MYAIYALIDPRDQTVRYIGQTNDVYTRFSAHIKGAGGTLAKVAWIFELRTLNKMVIMETLEEVKTYEQALEREAYWIKHFVMLKAPLFNITHRESSKEVKKAQITTTQRAMSNGIAVLKRRRAVEVASLAVGSDAEISALFFEERLSVAAILRKKYPHIKGGDAYQKKALEINNAIRACVEVAQEANGSVCTGVLSELEARVEELFIEKGMNPAAIVRELWPEIKGGDAYQKKSVEVADAIRSMYKGKMGGA